MVQKQHNTWVQDGTCINIHAIWPLRYVYSLCELLLFLVQVFNVFCLAGKECVQRYGKLKALQH